jgi:all-trans-8'-apo-beta-carotenal 15,15'-oxygenase
MPWTLNEAKHGPFDQEDWAWAYSTVPPEASCASYPCTNVEGTIPTDLKGTFYRIGPGNFERGGRRYSHVLDGDGFVASFRLADGTCTYAGRFVETEAFLKEQQKDDVLYRNVFGTQRRGGMFTNAFDLRLKNVANTNLLKWGNRMFALWEGGRPYELDPATLAVLSPTEDGPFDQLGHSDSTRGITVDEGGPIDHMLGLGRSFTAHPHIINNDTLVALRFGQNPSTKELKMEFVEYDSHWKVRQATKYTVPDTPAAPHDMSVSPTYYGFIQNRFDLDNVPFLLGMKSPTQVMQVPLNEPARLHLVPRRPTDESEEPIEDSAIIVDIPNYFCIHNLCRMEESDDGSTLTLYSNGWNLKDPRFFPADQESVPFLGSWGGRCPDFANQVVPPSMLYRTIVDLAKRQLVSHEEVVPGLVIEFPTQEDAPASNDNRDAETMTYPDAIYCSIASSDYTSMPGTGHCKVDTKHNTVKFWWAEPKIFTGEMTPVAKRNGESGSWLLTLLFDAVHRRASLAILDSKKFEQGPVARIHLPHALAYCLHGTFVEE